MSTILDRIALLLQASEPTAAAVSSLLNEVRDEIGRLDRERADARATSLDPLASAPAATRERAAIDEIAHETERLGVAAERLEEKLHEARRREEEAERIETYNTTKRATDALAADFRAEYERITGELVDLLTRMRENEQAVAAVNARVPQGVPHLIAAEHAVRGCAQGWELRHTVRLPDFQRGAQALVWQKAEAAPQVDLSP